MATKQKDLRPSGYKPELRQSAPGTAAEQGADSAHFTVYCGRYPAYSFTVPAVRRLRAREQGVPERETGVTFQFERGVFDTVQAGLSETEAELVREFLEGRNTPPVWGVHILENSLEVLGSDPAGLFQCPLCALRFSSQSGFINHVQSGHHTRSDVIERPLELGPGSIAGTATPDME